jgi:hypothetical protein
MTETQQRFLRAIAERVPMEQVVELHLFPPIRQGGVETGVAVVAEEPRRPVPNVVADGAATADVSAAADSSVQPVAFPAIEPDAPVVDLSAAEAGEVDESPYADDEVEDAPATETDGDAPVAVMSRLIIHTARYRLTLKGVDRGKWEVDVVAEADAPLEALDAVVRGVQRRSGEGAEPDRLNAEAFRGALEAPLATLER